MNQNIDLEAKVIQRFVKKDKQERYLGFVSSSKNRWKFTKELPHFKDFKWNLFEALDKNEDFTILTALQGSNLHGKSCYVISFDPEIDTKEMDVSDAIAQIINYNMGTILVFGDAEMIVYGGEEVKSRYISKGVN
jgi:hypothetical protein